MRRVKVGLLAVVLTGASCSTDAVQTTTTPDRAIDPTTTTAIQPTATTLPRAVEIPGRGAVWDEGTTYVAGDFIVPVAFTPSQEGWRSFGAGEAWVLATWFDPESVEESVSLLAVAHRSSDPIQAVVDSIVGDDGVQVITAPRDVTVAGEAGVSFDVEGLPHRLPQSAPCSGGSGFFFNTHPLGLIGDGYQEYGIPACGMTRVWVVGAGSTVTFLASTLQAERFDELMQVAELLLDSMTFESS